MPRMIEVIRQSALPSNVMQFAAKGALLVPPAEMLEILVYLALHNKVFGEQARMTLAGWDEKSARDAASDRKTPTEVLEYLVDPNNLRPALFPELLENTSVKESSVANLARRGTREQIELMLKSERVNSSQVILKALLENARLSGPESHIVREKLSQPEGKPAEAAAEIAPTPVPQHAAPDFQPKEIPETADIQSDEPSDEGDEEALKAYLAEHASEITAELGKPFQPMGGVYGDTSEETPQTDAAVATTGSGAAAAPARHAPGKKWTLSADEQRGTALQKIAKLDIKGRIQLAMKGNKEERSLLIRDGTKIVALAVLESPKITDGEVEKFAGQKNVLEAVLRAIPMKRRFIKLYPVVRALCFNPRTPIDVALGLMKNLLTQDLRHLGGNKEVSDTVRKLAIKMFRQKLDVTKK